MTKKKKEPILSLPLIDTEHKVYNELTEVDKIEISKPFEHQVFGMPQDHVNNMTLNQDDRVWLLRKDDIRDRIIRADLQKYVDDVYNKTSVMLVAQLSEVLQAHWDRQAEANEMVLRKVELISDDIKEMKGNFERRVSALEEAAKYHVKLDAKDKELEGKIENLANCGFVKRPWYMRPLWIIVSKLIEMAVIGAILAYLHDKFWR